MNDTKEASRADLIKKRLETVSEKQIRARPLNAKSFFHGHITSRCGTATEYVSFFIENYLCKEVNEIDSRIKDTQLHLIC